MSNARLHRHEFAALSVERGIVTERPVDFDRLRYMRCGTCAHEWEVDAEWIDRFHTGDEPRPKCGTDCTSEHLALRRRAGYVLGRGFGTPPPPGGGLICCGRPAGWGFGRGWRPPVCSGSPCAGRRLIGMYPPPVKPSARVSSVITMCASFHWSRHPPTPSGQSGCGVRSSDRRA